MSSDSALSNLSPPDTTFEVGFGGFFCFWYPQTATSYLAELSGVSHQAAVLPKNKEKGQLF